MSYLQSLSSSDSESIEPEYLMNTRERRSNAGNRMKALLQQEVDKMQQRTEHMDQDELDLLFKEDDDDEDFDIDPLTQRKSQTNGNSEVESITKDSEDQDLVMSSDSDISDSEVMKDGSDEEAQIRREEKLQKRKRQKLKNRSTTVIKRKKPSGDNEPISRKKRSNSVQLNPESLLQAERRTSKRSSVVANKLKVYENLSQAEQKRKIIRERLKKTREKAIEHILTQEDRMAIALETEKFNLLSLNKYKELELSKKQTRLALQQREKIKFKPQEIVETLLSTTWNISPEVEIEDELYWSNELKKREKKKRKYVRKSKKGDETVSDTKKDNTNAANDVETREYETKNIPDQKEDNLDKSIKQNPENTGSPVEKNVTKDETENITKTGILDGTTDNSIDTNKATDKGTLGEGDRTKETINCHPQEDNANPLTEAAPTNAKDETMNIYSSSHGEHNQKNENEENIKKQVSFDINPTIEIIENSTQDSTTANVEPASPSLSASSQENTLQSVTSTGLEDLEEPKPIYEGPLQQVSKNFLTKYSVKHNLTFTLEFESPYFFDYVTPDRNHLSPDSFRPLIHSRLSDNDMIAETEGIVKEGVEILPNLDILTTFRKFGEFDRKFEKILKVSEIKNEDIKINTPAPMGIYTANNNVKKLCLINNKSCKYFDPNLGVPYSDLISYKIIQDIQNSGESDEYKWFGFRNGGVYLKAKERHAHGVPDGF